MNSKSHNKNVVTKNNKMLFPIKMEDVTKSFSGNNKVLNQLSMSIRKGEVVGLLGENGAGKTTAFRILSSLLSPTSGNVFINGVNVQSDPEFTRSKIGILFGADPGLYDRLSARENILYFARLHGMDCHSAEKSIRALSRKLDIDSFIDKRTGSFSRGMKLKTAIARALVHNPDVLLLDEPSAGLDSGSTHMVHTAVDSLSNSGKTILISTHNVHEIQRLCTRVIILHKGILIDEGTPHSLEKKYKIKFERLFLKLTGYIQ